MTKEAEKLGKESAIPEVYTNEYDHITSTNGLSKREFFAAMAMMGMTEGGTLVDVAAKEAVEYADALLEELCKTDKT